MSNAVPAWLKVEKPLVWFAPEQILFAPQRRIVPRNGQKHLLDYTDRAYPLAECYEPRLEWLRGVGIFVDEEGYEFSMVRQGDRLILNDGLQRAYLEFLPANEGLLAAQNLAEAFGGAIVADPDGETWNALKLGAAIASEEVSHADG